MFQCCKKCNQNNKKDELMIGSFQRVLAKQQQKISREKAAFKADSVDIFTGRTVAFSLEDSEAIDKSFPPNMKSLNYAKGNRKIIWRKLSQLMDHFVIGTPDSIQNLEEGNVEDSYFLPAISAIGKNFQRIERIFGSQMHINPKGFYTMNIYQEGLPVTITIDDFIPVFQSSEEPVFYKPKENQAWIVLLEKVWAKLCGSYGNISHKSAHDVFSTFLPAPCIHELIPLSLRGQKVGSIILWQKIAQACDMNVPLCVNSRVSNLTVNIRTAQSYNIDQMKQIISQSGSQRTLQLKNLCYAGDYTGQYETGGKNKQKENILSLTLERFIENFESVDICYDRCGFNYNIEQTASYSCAEKYFLLTLKDRGQVYFTAHKSNIFPAKKYPGSYFRFVLLKKVQNRENQFQYVDAQYSRSLSNLTIYYPKLRSGMYIALIEGSSANLFQQQTLSISIYSEFKARIREIIKPHPYLLHEIFGKHARQHLKHCELSPEYDEDWTVSKFFEKESGYGYIAVHIGTLIKYKVKILCDLKKIHTSGFILLEQDKEQSNEHIQINLNQNNPFSILVFSLNFRHSEENLHFPPKGVKITKIF